MLPGTVAKYFTTCNPEHNITWKIHPEIGYKVGRSSLLRILLYYFTGKNLTRVSCITHSTTLQKENVHCIFDNIWFSLHSVSLLSTDYHYLQMINHLWLWNNCFIVSLYKAQALGKELVRTMHWQSKWCQTGLRNYLFQLQAWHRWTLRDTERRQEEGNHKLLVFSCC